MATLAPVDADPVGDLNLLVGTKALSIRVSAKVLSLASSVFAAMLSPRFAEGQASGQKDWTVSLPEDDPEAMCYICLALHYRQKFDHVVASSLLEKAAVLCDKYDLAAALKGSSELILQKWMINAEGTKECTTLLRVSYALDGHQAFWSSTCKLLYRCDGIDEKEANHHETLLPHDLLARIKAGRENILTSLQSSAEDALSLWITRGDNSALNTTAHCLRELYRSGLWPPTAKIRRSTVQEVLTKFRDISACTHSHCSCNYFAESLQAAAEVVEGKRRGLCLKCVKNGLVLTQDGNCGALLPVECGNRERESVNG